jgi:hypothetical protein
MFMTANNNNFRELELRTKQLKGTEFCAAVQRKFWNLPAKYLKLMAFCSATGARNFGIFLYPLYFNH